MTVAEPTCQPDNPLRALFTRLATEFAGLARLQVTALSDSSEQLELLPYERGAAAVLVEHIPTAEHGEVHLIVADDDTEDDLTYNDLPWIEQVVGLAVAGRIQVLEGRGRRRVEFLMPDGTRRSSTAHVGWRGLLPAPGWRRHALTTGHSLRPVGCAATRRACGLVRSSPRSAARPRTAAAARPPVSSASNTSRRSASCRRARSLRASWNPSHRRRRRRRRRAGPPGRRRGPSARSRPGGQGGRRPGRGQRGPGPAPTRDGPARHLRALGRRPERRGEPEPGARRGSPGRGL